MYFMQKQNPDAISTPVNEIGDVLSRERERERERHPTMADESLS
jgi:hypothetical protein